MKKSSGPHPADAYDRLVVSFRRTDANDDCSCVLAYLRWVRARYHHVEINFYRRDSDCMYGVYLTYEKPVEMKRATFYNQPGAWECYTVSMDRDRIRRAFDRCAKDMGKTYDPMANFKAFGPTSCLCAAASAESDTTWCTKQTASTLLAAGVLREGDVRPETCKPDDIWRAIRDLPDTRRLALVPGELQNCVDLGDLPV